ncbi:hypothetical protein PS15p_204280 [Mucor circinelloides]
MPTKPVDSRKLKSAGAAGPSGSKGKRTEKRQNVTIHYEALPEDMKRLWVLIIYL